jgi:hypothetical protein
VVFVSHAGRDLAWAEWVAWQLRDAGYELELGDLPLAVAQAAGVLAENTYTPRQYLNALTGHADELMADGAPLDYATPLAAAIAVSVERLTGEDPAAVQLVRHCAALAPEPIPIDIFDTARKVALPEPLATVASSTRSTGRDGPSFCPTSSMTISPTTTTRSARPWNGRRGTSCREASSGPVFLSRRSSTTGGNRTSGPTTGSSSGCVVADAGRDPLSSWVWMWAWRGRRQAPGGPRRSPA